MIDSLVRPGLQCFDPNLFEKLRQKDIWSISRNELIFEKFFEHLADKLVVEIYLYSVKKK